MPTKKKGYRYIRLTCPKCGANIRGSRNMTPPLCGKCTDFIGENGVVAFKFNPTPGDAE